MPNQMTAKNRLTHGYIRTRILHRTVAPVMVRINYNGQIITCETPEEAIAVLRYIKRENKTEGMTHQTVIHEVWNNRIFWKFVESLGESQERVLQMLLKSHKVTDVQLRDALGLESNRQLSGVLSGISKQAAAHDIPARAVYHVETESKSGEVTRSYVIAHEFSWIAMENNWGT